jgi:hypothetical protein
LYLHDPSLVKHEGLQAFCFGMLRVAHNAHRIVRVTHSQHTRSDAHSRSHIQTQHTVTPAQIFRAQVYHEEDFNSSTYQFRFAEDRTSAWLRDILDKAKESLVVQMEALKGKDAREEEEKELNAILDRLRFVLSFHEALELSDDVTRISRAQKAFTLARKYLTAAKGTLSAAKVNLDWEVRKRGLE